MKVRAIIPGLLLLIPLSMRGQANDSCSAAVALPVNTTCIPVNGDLATATQSQPAAFCNNSTSDEANDIWYTFTATTAFTTIEVTGGLGIDPVLEVFEGTCDSLISIGCSDQTFFGGTETITLATLVDSTYFVRVYYWTYAAPPSDFAFTICAYEGSAPVPPANDQCGNVLAVALAVGSPLTFTGTTVDATSTNDYGSTSPWINMAPSVWHVFTLGTCAHVTVSYCGIDPEFTNVWLLVMTSCPADSGVYTSGWDITTCGDGNVTLHFDSLAAGTYYLPVLSDVDHAYGPYSIEVVAASCFVGVEEIASDALEWSLYPVPNDGDFALTADRSRPVDIDVIDAWGHVCLHEQEVLLKNTPVIVHGHGRLMPGVYIVRMTTEGGSVSRRMVVR